MIGSESSVSIRTRISSRVPSRYIIIQTVLYLERGLTHVEQSSFSLDLR